MHLVQCILGGRELSEYARGNVQMIIQAFRHTPCPPPRDAFTMHNKYIRCGKPWGSTVAPSKLFIQWHAARNTGSTSGSLTLLWRQNEWREERSERRCRASEAEGESKTMEDTG